MNISKEVWIEQKLSRLDEKFHIPVQELYELLTQKGVTHLFHANTVQTAVTFIRANAILSRHYVEINQLLQTSQKSDAKDKAVNVWDDVFLDGFDLHKTYRQANHYGPILFKLRINLLLDENIKTALVTKQNPYFWHSQDTWEDRYYSNIEDIKNDYLTGKNDSKIMFTFRSVGKAISLSSYLEVIGIDSPDIKINFNSISGPYLSTIPARRIEQALAISGLHNIPISYRHSEDRKPCNCSNDYTQMAQNDLKEFIKRFLL